LRTTALSKKENLLMPLSPIKWFTDGKIKWLSEYGGKIDRGLLEIFNWEGDYLWSREFDPPPNKAGVYIYIHEGTDDFLYVGQTKNIGRRAFNVNHHKLKWIINRLENFPYASYDRSSVYDNIYVYYKEVKSGDFCNSLKRSLIWCECITIGLLKPVFQDDISDIYDFETGTGELRFIDEELDDLDEELDDVDEEDF
jgi:hypothetical protein